MKKIFLLFTAAVLAASCDGDSPASLENNYTSTVKIDGELFEPSSPEGGTSYVTTSSSGGFPDITERNFTLRRNPTETQDMTAIAVHMVYNTSATGPFEYTLQPSDPDPLDDGIYCNAHIEIGNDYHPLDSGSIKMTDLGNNKYRLEFNDVTKETPTVDGTPARTLSGTFEGTFTDVPLEL